jgi:hypothetical protein
VVSTGAFCDRLSSAPLAAVVAAAGEAPFVYGHSSGASLALEAAGAGVPVRKLAR